MSNRTTVTDEQGNRVGWFSTYAVTGTYRGATRFDGHNYYDINTGDQWASQQLYRTANGRWVAWTSSARQGVASTYHYLDDSAAERWLIANGEDEAAEKWFGSAEESGPGRPAIGGPVQIRFTERQRAALDRFAVADGTTVADLVRDAVDALIAARV